MNDVPHRYRVRWGRLAALVGAIAIALVIGAISGVDVTLFLAIIVAIALIGIIAGHFNAWGGPAGAGDRFLDKTPATDDDELKRPRDEGGLL
jgi:hypothetical protein